ncbi:hypothetical protein [Ruthenibacterium lactatiformans]
METIKVPSMSFEFEDLHGPIILTDRELGGCSISATRPENGSA